MNALDMLAQLGRDWAVTLTNAERAPHTWTLRLRSRSGTTAGDSHIYTGDDLSRVIARAYLGEPSDRRESRYARD